MRFAFTSCVLSLLCPAMLMSAAQAQTYPRAEPAKAAADIRAPDDLRHRAAGSRDIPVLPSGLYAERAASGLGHITAMVSTENGSIYALDTDGGQLFHLTDRGLDGRMDTRRTLTDGFDTPSGLTVKDGDLYVSDKQAIWRVDIDSGAKSQFVSLKNVAADESRPLLAFKDKILLGLSASARLSKVLSIDGASGVAIHLTDIPEGPIRGLSYGGGQLWAAAGSSLRPVDTQANSEFAKSYPLEQGAAALGLLLPSEDMMWPAGWPSGMKDYILALQGPTAQRARETSSGGNNIAALPTQFGAPTAELSVLVGGFMSRDGTSAWAAPSAFLVDSRGLFYADRIGGALWRVSVDNRPAPKQRAKIGKAPPAMPVQKPSLKPNETPAMTGSMIGEASSLGPASTLKVGSLLKQEHDEKEAAKLAAEAAAKDAELKAKTDAREARRLERQGRPPED